MENKLTREEVLHVAHLARIYLTEEEITRFQRDLKIMIDEIDKIKDLNDFDEDILITPIDHKATFREDEVKEMLPLEDVMKNAPKKEGNFIEVPVMLNE